MKQCMPVAVTLKLRRVQQSSGEEEAQGRFRVSCCIFSPCCHLWHDTSFAVAGQRQDTATVVISGLLRCDVLALQPQSQMCSSR